VRRQVHSREIERFDVLNALPAEALKGKPGDDRDRGRGRGEEEEEEEEALSRDNQQVSE